MSDSNSNSHHIMSASEKLEVSVDNPQNLIQHA